MIFQIKTSFHGILLAFLVLSLNSCNKSGVNATQKIDSGISINQNSANKAEGVFSSITMIPGSSSGGGCTGTAVSSTTAMTAGHCVYRIGDKVDAGGKVLGKQYCISNNIYKSLCSTEIYVNPSYPSHARLADGGTDFAFVVFPVGTFKTYFTFHGSALKISDDILFVGYSEENMPDLGLGSKRFGFNKIAAFDSAEHSDIIANYGGTSQSVSVSPGDSGGPLFKNCQLIGVASRMTEDHIPKQSIHTNLMDPANLKVLKSSPNGYFCGLSGMDETMCPKNRDFRTVTAPKPTDSFPCDLVADNSQNNPTPPSPSPQPVPPTPPAPQSSSQIFAALNEQNELSMRGEVDIINLSVCGAVLLDDAKKCTTSLNTTSNATTFKTVLPLNSSTKDYFVRILATRRSDNSKVEQIIKVSKR